MSICDCLSQNLTELWLCRCRSISNFLLLKICRQNNHWYFYCKNRHLDIYSNNFTLTLHYEKLDTATRIYHTCCSAVSLQKSNCAQSIPVSRNMGSWNNRGPRGLFCRQIFSSRKFDMLRQRNNHSSVKFWLKQSHIDILNSSFYLTIYKGYRSLPICMH